MAILVGYVTGCWIHRGSGPGKSKGLRRQRQNYLRKSFGALWKVPGDLVTRIAPFVGDGLSDCHRWICPSTLGSAGAEPILSGTHWKPSCFVMGSIAIDPPTDCDWLLYR
jgi:hypothetical protein